MKNLTILLLLITLVLAATACKKKEPGICYCKYVSGDKKEFNLTSLSADAARDSCRVLDGNANAFGGECEMK